MRALLAQQSFVCLRAGGFGAEQAMLAQRPQGARLRDRPAVFRDLLSGGVSVKFILLGLVRIEAVQLVPYTLAGSALVYLLTRNVTRALSVLMVDFSCALKLSMPLAVLSAMSEASFSSSQSP